MCASARHPFLAEEPWGGPTMHLVSLRLARDCASAAPGQVRGFQTNSLISLPKSLFLFNVLHFVSSLLNENEDTILIDDGYIVTSGL
ncbi:hypothetical protein ACN38_g10002 [Penicillium nordicum]|uniref:Uncharacterized protein n=1 Tax=Penicillium nordicum TaxID=229535 RepID=A0A0M8P2M6_9EURO|nr:hypothetical protein ACN38_g10002 [Penicillium nordicum]